MAKISDVEIPTLLFDEQGSDPSTPAATLWRLYFKSGGLFAIDDAGAVVGPFSAGGSGITPQVARVETVETSTTTTFTDLTTAGPAVTVTVGAAGILIVNISCKQFNNNGAGGAAMSFALSGANTLAAADARRINTWVSPTTEGYQMGATFVLTGLNSGSTTATAKYRVLGGTGTGSWGMREVSAWVP